MFYTIPEFIPFLSLLNFTSFPIISPNLSPLQMPIIFYSWSELHLIPEFQLRDWIQICCAKKERKDKLISSLGSKMALLDMMCQQRKILQQHNLPIKPKWLLALFHSWCFELLCSMLWQRKCILPPPNMLQTWIVIDLNLCRPWKAGTKKVNNKKIVWSFYLESKRIL